MKKTVLLAFSNIRKSKGHTFSYLILIMLAMAMLTAGVATYFGCTDNFEQRYTELNAEDGLFAISNAGYTDKLYDDFSKDNRVKSSEIRDIMIFDGKFDYSNGFQATTIMVFNQNNQGKMGKTEIVEKAKTQYENGCYLPIIFKTGGKYKLGDNFTMKSSMGNYTFKVQGFFDNLYLGSTSLPAVGVMLTDESYESLEKQTKGAFDGKYLLARLYDRNNASDFAGGFYTKHCAINNNSICALRIFYSGALNGRTFMSKIIASIIVAFSIIVVIISLVVIRFRIINSIEDDIKNIGVLKAMGYTSKNLIASYIIQFGLICISGIVVGIVLALMIIPVVSNTIANQSGMVGSTKISLPMIALLSLVVLAIVELTVFFTSCRIKSLHPITALRNGFKTHNFKKNHFAFDKTVGGVNWIFGLKNTVANLKQNIMCGVIIAVVSFICMFAYTLYYNMCVDNKAFVDAISGEIPSIQVVRGKGTATDEIIKDLAKDSKVRKVINSSRQTLTVANSKNVYTYIYDDFSNRDTDICYDGRNPTHENECAMGGLAAKEMGIKIGDEVELSLENSTQKYIVTGLVQSSNNMGYDAELTTEGMKKLSPEWTHTSVYVYLNDGVDCDDYVNEITDKFGTKAKEIISISSILDAQLGAYVDMTKIITIIIAVITCLVITMILYLVIKTMISKSRKSVGIQKALGYTTPQLMIQLALSFMPVTVIGCAVGFVGAVFGTNGTFALFLNSIGIMQMNLKIMTLHFVIIALSVVIYSLLIAFLISIKIKKVSPYKMLTDE